MTRFGGCSVVGWLLLMLVALSVTGPASTTELPRIDEPYRTGARSAGDYGVVVGIESYPFLAGLDVEYAYEDAEAFETFLVYTLGLPPERVHLLRGGSRGQIEAALAEAGRLTGPDDTVWFYFSGHGAASARDDERLLLGDTVKQDAEQFESAGVHLDDAQELAGAGGANVVFVLDACYSGVGRDGTALAPGGKYVPHSAVRVLGRSTVWSAASANDVAGSYEPAGHSAFTYFAVGALRGWADGELDGQRDGRVTAEEANRYVARALLTAGIRTQTPALSGGGTEVLSRGAELGPDLMALRKPDPGGGQVERGVMLDRGEDIVNEQRDETGFLLVRVEPSEATIVINGEEVGQGAVQLEKMVGQYVVVGELGALYHPARQEIELGPDGARLALTLPPAYGMLAVTSEPSGAEVWVEGEQVGVTPWRAERKPSGTYDVRVALAEYLSDTTAVTVADEQTAKHHVSLTPNFGTLTVASDPVGAAIALNGADTGALTPSTFERVTAGIAEVRLSLAGYGEWVERPTVERQGAVRLDVTLEAKLGALTVLATDAEGSPCEADVEVAGQSVGRTPLKVDLPSREHEVTVRYGNQTLSQTASVVHNDKVMLQFEFVPGAGLEGLIISEHGYEMLAIEAGEFWMGSPSGEKDRDADETRHRVSITQVFAIGTTEVTQGLYESVMGENPSHFKGGRNPVENVSWHDAVKFCNRLSELEGLDAAYRISGETVTWDRSANGYRLPTESEWEYAARGGESYLYSGSNDVDEVAWVGEEWEGGHHEVGGKQTNAWSLFDMSGNVWEWVWDWKGSYPSGTVTDTMGPSTGSYRVFRGGSWNRNPRYARVANRSRYVPGRRYGNLGLRLARSL